MDRLALLLVATSGCNAFFGLSEQEPVVQVCGPYAAPVPVVFAGAALDGAYDLSLDATATHGLVRVGSGPNPTIVPIVLMPDGTYAEDPTREANLAMLRATGMFQAHITASVNHVVRGTTMGTLDADVLEDVFAAVRPTQSTDYEIEHYAVRTKTPPGWQLAEVTAVDAAPGVSAYPGNELELTTSSATLFTRYLTVVRVDENLARTVDVDETLPNSAVWMPEQVNHIPVADQINSVHVVQQAVLAFGTLASTDPAKPVITHPLTLVYNATLVGSSDNSPQLYASPKTAEGYGIGSRIGIAIADGDVLEPWVNVDCTTLWFRRDATVYRADAM